jgi:hypothetical protein
MTRRHLRLVPAAPPASLVPSSRLLDETRLAAHEFLRKPRSRDYPYDVCIELLEGAIEHHVRRGQNVWRWTDDDVADLLSSWFPEPPLDDPERLRYLPDLIGDFIAFAHRDRVPPHVTAAIATTIDRVRPEFLCIVGAFDWKTPPYHRPPEPAEATHPLQDLADLVGGLVALEHLDTTPLPDESFAWTEVPDELAPGLEDLLPLLDACADQLLTREHRTAMRRFTATVARRDSRPLCRGTVARRAAAVAWGVLRANDDLGPGRGRLLTAKELATWFGLDRELTSVGRTMVEAGGGSFQWSAATRDRVSVGDARVLTAQRRAAIIADRDRRDLGAGSEPEPRWPFS